MGDAADLVHEASPCRWCGEDHGPLCPWVRAIEFDPVSGIVTRVEFVTIGSAQRERREGSEPEEDARDYPRLPKRGT